jgi:hypothetical protein
LATVVDAKGCCSYSAWEIELCKSQFILAPTALSLSAAAWFL